MFRHAISKIIGLAAFSSFATAGNSTFYSGVSRCPAPCNVSGSNPTNWTVYGSQATFNRCAQTVIIDFGLYADLNSNTPTKFSTCTATFSNSAKLDSSAGSQADLQLISSNVAATFSNSTQITSAATQLQGYLVNTDKKTTHALSLSGNALVAAYVGSDFLKSNMVTGAIQTFLSQYPKSNAPETLILQLCGSGRNGNQLFGIIASTKPSSAFSIVQSAVKAWNNATCATLDSSTTSTLRGITIYETIQPTIAGLNSTSSSNSSQISRQGASFKSAILPRTNCQTTQVVSGDSCAGLAARCGITAAQFTTFNPSSTLCSTLAVGEFVCCSSGTLPDLTPKENPDGSCFAYLVQSGDFCDSIAASNMITSAEIETWNAATWGWTSCSDLQTGMNICLSPGSPPMPVPISNAECGPQKPGTTTPPSGTDLASLNPCPLNVCCDIWGQCGTTPDFCTTTGINRCVSNCGQDPIVGSPPPEFRSIAYFEGYTTSRPCLYWDIGNVDARPYTHMHMAFAGLDSNFNVDVSDIQEQFNLFVDMPGLPAKRILTIGGWSFSNDPTTYMMFRNAVEPENWLTVAENIAIFIERNGLDGVDIDWEYPGATDIPGTPPGDPVNDGNNLLGLLLTLRSVLQPGLTISMAIPSSYWYLRNFPIATMAQVCDYFVFMTYDLHGQWDYGNAFSDPGCPGGNCLRSHVNYTETINAITMITKAGVPSGQVAVGVSSYGRSFQMVDPGCPTEMCEYTGPDSGALAGPCTDEPGYISNAEINGIIASNKAAKIYFDDNSYSNVMYYDDQWVAYMDDTNKATRALLYQEIALGGTADWAYDLAEFSAEEGNPYLGQVLTGNKPGTSWDTVDCSNPGINPANQDQSIRWADLFADQAWQAAVAEWKSRRDSGTTNGLDFVKTISDFFHGPEGYQCGGTSAAGCDGNLECGMTSHPAGYFILNSLFAVNIMNTNFFINIIDEGSLVTDWMGTFTAEFAPIKDETAVEKLIIDILGLAWSLAAGPTWAFVIKKLPYFTIAVNPEGPDRFEALKDMINGLVAGGLQIASDEGLVPPALGQLNALDTSVGNMINAWANDIIANLNQNLFNGSDSSCDALTSLISDGKMNEANLVPVVPGSAADPDTHNFVLDAMYAVLIPQAWSLSNEGIHPFILDSGFKCDLTNPVWANPIPNYISDDTAQHAWYCDPTSSNYYFLLSATGDAKSCSEAGACGTNTQCTDHQFSLPPGVTSLDGKQFGGITVQDFVNASLATYRANGNVNGGPLLTNADDSTNAAAAIFDEGMHAPGVVEIWVCDQQIAWSNWVLYSPDPGIGIGGGGQGPFFPCDALTTSPETPPSKHKRSAEPIPC